MPLAFRAASINETEALRSVAINSAAANFVLPWTSIVSTLTADVKRPAVTVAKQVETAFLLVISEVKSDSTVSILELIVVISVAIDAILFELKVDRSDIHVFNNVIALLFDIALFVPAVVFKSKVKISDWAASIKPASSFTQVVKLVKSFLILHTLTADVRRPCWIVFKEILTAVTAVLPALVNKSVLIVDISFCTLPISTFEASIFWSKASVVVILALKLIASLDELIEFCKLPVHVSRVLMQSSNKITQLSKHDTHPISALASTHVPNWVIWLSEVKACVTRFDIVALLVCCIVLKVATEPDNEPP